MFKRRNAAIALGWFSIGLGVSELAFGGLLGRAIGMRRGHGIMMRACGLREVVTGIGLLRNASDPRPWFWARVVGDVMDVGALGRALVSKRNARGRLGVAGGAVLGVTAADVLCATML